MVKLSQIKGVRAQRRALKRRFLRRKIGARRRAMGLVNNALQPIPQRFIVKMKYADDVYANASGLYTFNLNSIFDPNRTGAGHQPYGFDQFATLYNRYRVISCSWRVTAPSSTNTVQLGCIPTNEAITPATFAELKENPRAKYVIQHVGGNVQLCKGRAYIPSLVGRTKAQYMADDRYQATVLTDPAELAVLNIMTANNAGVGQASQVINVLLEYVVEFFDVKPLAQS